MVTANKLSPKQTAFARNYVDNNGNGSAAAVAAGYSKATSRQKASQLLTKVDIQAELTRLRSIPERTSASTRAFVLDNLHTLAVNGKPDSARVAATVALGKTERMFVEISESTVTHELPELAGVPLSELLAIRAEIARQQEQPQLASKQPVIEVKALPVEESD